MGCSSRAKEADIRADQKWDFISLGDFKSTSCFTPLAYVWLIGMLLVSIAVYGVDTFTAVNLLVFDRWSGLIEPAIPLNISKWIFSACIIASWVNLGYEYVRAIRVIKRGAVAESYLDSLAVRLQCIRPGRTGRGWRRFLVFAELTKSKKGAEYVALFTYFAFQSWIRIIFCQGPRQVVNALTLWAVFQAKLLPADAENVGSAIGNFFEKFAVLAEQSNQQAVILSGMLFTLVIWVFGALSLILAILFYIFFLWHYIPNRDGGLTGYCENKTNKRLAAIVSVKVNKAIEEEERMRRKADAKALKKGEKPVFGRQATLPTLFNPKESKDGDKLPQMPMLDRNDTMATLPVYSSRPGTPSGKPTTAIFELDQLENKRPGASRSETGTSFSSNAPLMGNASDMGYRSESPAPSLPPLDRNGYPPRPGTSNSQINGFPPRPGTANSQMNGYPPRPGTSNPQANGYPQRPGTSSSQHSQWNRGPPGPQRMPSAMADRGYTASPASYDNPPYPSSHISTNSQDSMNGYGPQGRQLLRGGDGRSNTPNGAPPIGRRPTYDSNFDGRNSPAAFAGSGYGRNSPGPSRDPGFNDYGRNTPNLPPAQPTPGAYQAYNPNVRSASAAPGRPGPTSQPYRNMTDPSVSQGPPQDSGDYFGNAVAPPRPGPSQGPNIARLASPGAYNNSRNSPGNFSPNGGPQDSYR